MRGDSSAQPCACIVGSGYKGVGNCGVNVGAESVIEALKGLVVSVLSKIARGKGESRSRFSVTFG